MAYFSKYVVVCCRCLNHSTVSTPALASFGASIAAAASWKVLLSSVSLWKTTAAAPAVGKSECQWVQIYITGLAVWLLLALLIAGVA